MPLVLDASTALAWYFDDEDSPYAERVLERLRRDAALVPAVWPLEIANGLLIAERRGRISAADRTRAIELTLALRITVNDASPTRALQVILHLARTQRLTSYDAAYLDLAMREGLVLATQDNDLMSAAKRVGVELFS